MEKLMCVYKIEHVATGDCYVGGTTDFQRRCWDHKSRLRRGAHRSANLQRTWNTHMEKAFAFSILEIVTERGTLLAREQHWMDKINPKFNIQRTAGSPKGQKATMETKAKLAAVARSRTFSPETRAKIATARKNQVFSPESTAKRAAANRGRICSPETRAKISVAKMSPSPETRAKLSAARIAYWVRKKASDHAT